MQYFRGDGWSVRPYSCSMDEQLYVLDDFSFRKVCNVCLYLSRRINARRANRSCRKAISNGGRFEFFLVPLDRGLLAILLVFVASAAVPMKENGSEDLNKLVFKLSTDIGCRARQQGSERN